MFIFRFRGLGDRHRLYAKKGGWLIILVWTLGRHGFSLMNEVVFLDMRAAPHLVVQESIVSSVHMSTGLLVYILSFGHLKNCKNLF